MLLEIHRKKCEPSAFPVYLKASEETSTSATGLNRSMSNAAEQENQCLLLMEENKNLRKQKMELQMQLSQFKALETKLLDCVGLYMQDHHNR